MSSKKSKKQKWKPIETEVISIASGTCWADEVEKEQNGFGGFGFEAKPLNLPKAPRAACESIIDESTVPQEGPFLVHMSNLQFEIDEDDITNYFKGLKIENIKLPRNDNGRNKGFGYVEFEERKELIVALGMENLIRGRRVRVELASGMQDSRNAFQRGSRMGMDFKSSDDTGDWRSTIRSSTTDDRGGFARRRDGGAFDKDHDSERDSGPWRGSRRNVDDDVGRKPFSDRRYDDPEGGRRPFGDRRGDDSEGGRRPPFGDRRGDDSEGGRRPPFGDRRGDDSDGSRRPFGDRRGDDFDGGRRPFGERRDDIDGGRKPFGESRRGFGFKRDDDLPEIAVDNTSLPQERPKLILKPKTVDKTEVPNYEATSSSIFGGAKPVDTAAKEREIEEKLLAKHEPPKPQLSAASSVTSLNEASDTKSQEETTEFKQPPPPPQPAKSVETWRRKSPRRQNDDDRLPPRRRVSPEHNPRYEEAPPPRENAWVKHPVINKEQPEETPDENVCNGITPIPPTEEEEEDKPRPNVYIPPNLRKKAVLEEQEVVVPDRAADGSEIIETVVVEAPSDVRTDPDGQSSEPDVLKQPPADATEVAVDANDNGFIECEKNKAKKKPKVVKKVSETEVKKKDPIVTKEQKKSTSNKFAALLDDGSNE